MAQDLTACFVDDISAISCWDRLAPPQPFLQADFLKALEHTQCVGANTGWQPHHLVLQRDNTTVAAMPLYLKSHSYGEYVFDFAWADAYYRYGLEYYPKLVGAIPFTPVPGPRLLTTNTEPPASLWAAAIHAVQAECQRHSISSLHLLFPDPYPQTEPGLLRRDHVQFLWQNRNYDSFDHFLSRFSSRKRKNVKKERQRLYQQNIQFRRLTGDDITTAVMDDFIHCYRQTYLKRSGHSGYLRPAFFHQIGQTMNQQLLIIRAEQHGRLLGSALLFFDQSHLYGRYWGALEPVDGLHFETCYYQGIEFCIEQGLQVFNPGTQGEHKIQRGFEPTYCHSGHWLARPEFHQAINEFVHNERRHVAGYAEQASSLLPFKRS